MRQSTTQLLGLLATLGLSNALTITSPKAGDFINPGLPLTITWSTSPSDPATIDLIMIHPSLDSANPITTPLGSSVAASANSLALPAWAVLDWGAGFTIQASAAGNPGAVIGNVGGLSLGGAVGQASTDAAGSVVGFVTSAVGSAQVGEAQASLTGAGAPATAGGVGASATTTAEGGSASGSGSTASTVAAETSATETSSVEESSTSATRSETSSKATSTGSQTASASASASQSASAAAGMVVSLRAVKDVVAVGWLAVVAAAVLA